MSAFKTDTLYQFVESEGPLDARIIICGESPWLNECASGRPFAGASGNLLKMWWGPLGLQRTEMRLMNLFPWRPPTKEIESVPTDRLVKAIEGVHERIARLKDPYVIVPMGNYATYALTGKGKVRANVRQAFSQVDVGATEADKKAGITQLRGSIYPYRDFNGRVIKVIPMIHPAGVLQMMKWEKRSIADWGRVQREATFHEIRQPQREHIINPTRQQIEEYCHVVYRWGGKARMAVDIETWGNTLSCVGFACSPLKSITIPLTGKGKENLPFVKWLCECEAEKVLCNGGYDWYWLDANGVQLCNYYRDVQSMHHALDPAESHSLDFLASIYCPYYCYWKDEAKEAEEIVKYARDLDSLYVYNGLDVCYTNELDPILEAELRKEGMWDFYLQHYAAMFEPLLRTMRHGMRVDVPEQKKKAKELQGELDALHIKLNELAGFELFATVQECEMRRPYEEEWDILLTKTAKEEIALHGKRSEIITAKMISREGRKELIKQGMTYCLSGKNTGKVRFKVEAVKKDFSNIKLQKFFHEKLGLPEMFKRKKGRGGEKAKKQSLDEDSIRKLMYKYARAVEPGKLLLEYRGKKKELDYVNGKWDRDGRMRCSYKMNTRAGRLSSSTNAMRTGCNLQNIPR